jgi:glycosyltransferase involved in cell wall biosynthesis
MVNLFLYCVRTVVCKASMSRPGRIIWNLYTVLHPFTWGQAQACWRWWSSEPFSGMRPGGLGRHNVAEKRLRVALVVQRYGLEVNGGAELLCRRVAEHLAPYHEVHALTTCALDYVRWKNHYPAGTEELNGVTVHRFKVDRPRRAWRFRRLTRRILSGSRPFFDQLEWMRQQGPISTPLFDHIQEQRAAFDVFVFFTYLYPTSYFGLQLVPEKAALVPAAHDEPFLYLDLFRPLFHLPRFLIYSTDPERELVERTFDNTYIPAAVVGTGIDVPQDIDAARFREQYDLPQSFVLYVGRIDNAKSCPELFDYFLRYKQGRPGDLKLVLMGKAVIPVPDHPDIVHVGFVPEADKFDGIAAASALIVPSRYESLSMVTLEAWHLEKPVLVNAACEVLRRSCLQSQGGLWYDDYSDFAAKLDRLLEQPELSRQLGRQGAAYVAEKYNWSIVERKYLEILKQVAGQV